MNDDTRAILDTVRRREELREAMRTPTDYAALNRMVKRQRAALTRAKNTGNVDTIVATVRAAVREWNQPGAMWPDDWATWQRTVNDALPWNQAIDIRRDLA